MSRGHGQLGIRSGLKEQLALVDNSSAMKEVIAELRPSLLVDDWTLDQGSTYVSIVDFQLGFRRDVVSVEALIGGALTRRESLADCRSTAGSYYYDADEDFDQEGFWDDEVSRWQLNGVDYDGAADHLTRGATLTGIADGKVGTLSCWVRIDGGDGGTRGILDSQGSRTSFRLATGNQFQIITRNAAGAIITNRFTPTGYAAGATWYHVLLAWDQANDLALAYINDTSIALSGAALTDDTIDYTVANWFVGSLDGPANYFPGALAQLWFDPASYLDLTDVGNRRKFIDANGRPVALGHNGQLPTGTSPILFLPGHAAIANINYGTGGDFALEGAPAEAGTSPPDNAVHLKWDQNPQLYVHLSDSSDPDDTTVVALLGFYYASRSRVHPHLGDDKLTNGTFEDWTAGDPDSWSVIRENPAEETTEIIEGASSLELPLTGVQGRATRFNGSTDYYARGADLTGNANGKVGTISFWFRIDGGDGGIRYLIYNTQGGFAFNLSSTGRLDLIGENAAQTKILRKITTATYTAGPTWHHYLASWNLATTTAQIYVDDIEITAWDTDTVTDDTIDYTKADWIIGATTVPGNYWNSAIAEFFFALEYIDLSVTANRRKFIDANGMPVWLGTDGALPTGTAPILYAPDGNPIMNYGTGGCFQTINGSPEQIPGPGSPEVSQEIDTIPLKPYRVSGYYKTASTPVALDYAPEAQMVINTARRYLMEDGRHHGATEQRLFEGATQDQWRRFAYDFLAAYGGATLYDGSADYYALGADLDGDADGKVGTISFWIKLAGGDSSDLFILGNENENFKVFRAADGVIQIVGENAADAVKLDIESDTTHLDTDAWIHVMASWDLGNSLSNLWVSNSDELTETTNADDDIDYTRAGWAIGAQEGGANFFNGGIHELWFAQAYVDLSVGANRLLFIDANNRPVYLGRNGELPTGSVPIIYSPEGNGTNYGYGGDLAAVGTPNKTPSADSALSRTQLRLTAETTDFRGVAGRQARDFDGGDDYYSNAADMTGSADGKLGTISFWMYLDGGDSVDLFVLGNEAEYFYVFRAADGVIQIIGKESGGDTILDIESDTTHLDTNAWVHVIASWDLGNSVSYMYVGDSDELTESTNTDDDIDYTRVGWAVGAQEGGVNFFNGGISELWFDPTTCIDFSVLANRRLFITAAGNPVDLGPTGALPTGLSPIIYLPNGDGANNKGPGGDFSEESAPLRILGPAALTSRGPSTVYFDDVKLQRIWRYNRYEPRLSTSSIPATRTGSNDIFFGGKRIGAGSVSMINEDGHFEALIPRLEWINRELLVLFGGQFPDGQELLIDDYQRRFTGLIQRALTTDRKATFDLQDVRAFFHITLPANVYDDITFPNLDTRRYLGKVRPIFFGVKENITPARIDLDGNGYGLYEICDCTDAPNGIKAIDTVYAYTDETTAALEDSTQRLELVEGTDYTEDLANGRIQIDLDVGPYELNNENDWLTFHDDAPPGGDHHIHLTHGLYTAAGLAAHIETSMDVEGDDDFTVTYDEATHLFTIASDGATFELHPIDETFAGPGVFPLIGFDISENKTGATSYTGDEVTFADADKDHVIRADAQGYKDDGSGTYTGSASALIEVGADILHTLLIAFMNKSSSIIDTASFTAARATSPETLAMFLKTPMSTKDLFDRLEYSNIANIVVDGAGKVSYKVYVGTVPANILDLYDRDFLDFRSEKSSADIYTTIRVKYDQNPSSGVFEAREQTDSSVRLRLGRPDVREFETFIKLADNAINVVKRMSELAKTSARKVTAKIRGSKVLRLEVGDKIRITRSRGLGLGGRITKEIFRIISIRKQPMGGVADFEATDDRVTVANTACILACQAFCESTCQEVCQQACQATCELECQTECESACQSACQQACQATCQLECQTECEANCQSDCELACESCQSGCEVSCEVGCQIACQTGCETTCESTCELACQGACQAACQSGCETACQDECEVSCETTCEADCQTTCELQCQTGCQVSCENFCQQQCQRVSEGTD